MKEIKENIRSAKTKPVLVQLFDAAVKEPDRLLTLTVTFLNIELFHRTASYYSLSTSVYGDNRLGVNLKRKIEDKELSRDECVAEKVCKEQVIVNEPWTGLVRDVQRATIDDEPMEKSIEKMLNARKEIFKNFFDLSPIARANEMAKHPEFYQELMTVEDPAEQVERELLSYPYCLRQKIENFVEAWHFLQEWNDLWPQRMFRIPTVFFSQMTIENKMEFGKELMVLDKHCDEMAKKVGTCRDPDSTFEGFTYKVWKIMQ